MSPRRRAEDANLVQEQRPTKVLRTNAPSHPPNDVVVFQLAVPSTSHGGPNLHRPPLAPNHRSPRTLWEAYEKNKQYTLVYEPLVSTRATTGDGYLKLSRLGNLAYYQTSQPRLGRQHEEGQDEEDVQDLGRRSFFNMRRERLSKMRVRAAQPLLSGVVHRDQEGDPDMDQQGLSLLKIPPGFGSNYSEPVSGPDASLEEYFAKAFCPGRTIKTKNNPWLQYIMPIQDMMVVIARRCVSALYVNDLTIAMSAENIRMKRIMEQAEMQIFERLKNIQEQCDTVEKLPPDTATELLAICPIMIQFDIINFEREAKVKLPNKPLRSYLIAFVIELLRTGKIDVGFPPPRNLETPAPGVPTVENIDSISEGMENYQFWPFILQVTLMIARHSILSEPMEDLTKKYFDADKERNKFDWLLSVGMSEAYQIDPRLGFSRMLLLYIHAVTYLTHGMLTGHRWRSPKIALAYLEKLREMKQWSKDYTTELTAKNNSQPIERIRRLGADYKTESAAEMTSCTAEAWRLAIIAYCQCRLLRYPRNHPEVIATLEDLHHCIRVQPTEGDLFTTEAPLYPVFLLGLLSTPENPHHRSTSQKWMVTVTGNTRRSTASPLRTALEKAWDWIDRDQLFTPPEPSALHPEIWQRPAWWETMVHRISRDERRLLCLT